MFELSVACKYLIPRWRQLSVSIISLVSILVIALVVWLIVVFFSVKDGLENSWVDKIIALTAPIRITPTDKYYASYYHQIDTISSGSDYTAKTIGEKLEAAQTDPYDPTIDEELPPYWPAADRDSQGAVIDLAKQAVASASNLSTPKKLKITDFETTVANVRLRLLRHMADAKQPSQQFLDQAAYIGSFDPETPVLAKALLPLSLEDFTNLFQMQAISADNVQEDSPEAVHRLAISTMQQRLQNFFQAVEVKALKTPIHGWRLPRHFLPADSDFQVAALLKDGEPVRFILPVSAKELPALIQRLTAEGAQPVQGILHIDKEKASLKLAGQDVQQLDDWVPIYLEGNVKLPAALIEESIAKASRPTEVAFNLHGHIQGVPVEGKATLDRFEIAEAQARADANGPSFCLPIARNSDCSAPRPIGRRRHPAAQKF